MLLCVVLMLCWSLTATEDEHAANNFQNQSADPDKEIQSRIMPDEPNYGIDGLSISPQTSPGFSGNTDLFSQANVPVLTIAPGLQPSLSGPSLLTNSPYMLPVDDRSYYAYQPNYAQNLPAFMQNQPSSVIYLLNNFPWRNNRFETAGSYSYTASVLSKLKNLLSVGVISPSYFLRNYNTLIGNNLGGYANPSVQNQLSFSNNYQSNSARFSSGRSGYNFFDTTSNQLRLPQKIVYVANPSDGQSSDASLNQNNFIYGETNQASLLSNNSFWSSGGLSGAVNGFMPSPSDTLPYSADVPLPNLPGQSFLTYNTMPRFSRPQYDGFSYSSNYPLANNVPASWLNKLILLCLRNSPPVSFTQQSSFRLWLSRLVASLMTFSQKQRSSYFSADPAIDYQSVVNQPSFCCFPKANNFVLNPPGLPADFSGSISIDNNVPTIANVLPAYGRFPCLPNPLCQVFSTVGSLPPSNPLRIWLNSFIQSLLVKYSASNPAYSASYNLYPWKLPNQQYFPPSTNYLSQSTYFDLNPPAPPADFSGSISIDNNVPPFDNFLLPYGRFSCLPNNQPCQAFYAIGSLSPSNPLRIWLNNFIQTLLVKVNNPPSSKSYNSYPWQLPNQQYFSSSTNDLPQRTYQLYSYPGNLLDNFLSLLKTFCIYCFSNMSPLDLQNRPRPSSKQGYPLPTSDDYRSIGYRSLPLSPRGPVKRSTYYSYYPARPTHLKSLFKPMPCDRADTDGYNSYSNDDDNDSDYSGGGNYGPRFPYDDDEGNDYTARGNLNDNGDSVPDVWLYGADRGSFPFSDDGWKGGGSARSSFGDGGSVGRRGGGRDPFVVRAGDSVVDDRIIGGEVVEAGELPYQVALYRLDMFECGSSLISHFYVLTAAHCLVKYYPEDMWFRVGSDSLIQGGDIYRVATFIVHERYTTSDYDIGLVKSASEIQFGPSVHPIRLPSIRDAVASPGTTVIASGWGTTSMDGDKLPTYQLHKLQLKLTSRSQCRNRIMSDIRLITRRQICTSAPVGAGTCFGDSGGPLVANGKLIGIVSWGSPCAIGDPDVYTNVRAFLPWIRQKTQTRGYNNYERNLPLPNLLYNTYRQYSNR